MIRAAEADDAAEMGRLMVASWLSGHRGQMPDHLWQKRAREWTPEVSAAGWSRLLAERAAGRADRVVLLVAEQHDELVGLVMGDPDDDGTGRIHALYVHRDRRSQGIGSALLAAAAAELLGAGCTALTIGVLTSNRSARAFYEALGGLEAGQRSFDEDGVLLPETVYRWTDLPALTRTGPPRPDRPTSP